MLEKAERGGSAIVVIGDFAPKMFHPSWFQSVGLLGKEEVEDTNEAKGFVVTDQFAQFQVAGLGFFIDTERFQVSTDREDLFEPARDIVQGAFSILDQVPTTAIGMNWYAHFRCGDEAKWHAAGDKIAPKQIWKKLWPGRPGMMDISMRLERDDQFAGHLALSVQPSATVKFGLYMSLNDHFDLKKDDKLVPDGVAALVKDHWPKSKGRAEKLFGQLYEELIVNV